MSEQQHPPAAAPGALDLDAIEACPVCGQRTRLTVHKALGGWTTYSPAEAEENARLRAEVERLRRQPRVAATEGWSKRITELALENGRMHDQLAALAAERDAAVSNQHGLALDVQKAEHERDALRAALEVTRVALRFYEADRPDPHDTRPWVYDPTASRWYYAGAHPADVADFALRKASLAERGEPPPFEDYLGRAIDAALAGPGRARGEGEE